MTRYWIGVASRDHVKIGEAGGFCQLGHGKHAPVKRLAPGDGIIYYAPRERLGDGDPVQAFVAIGRIRPGEAYLATQSEMFQPWRRDVDYFPSVEAPIRPLLGNLSFTEGRKNWGYAFRRGVFEVSRSDFHRIAQAMQADWPDEN
ncbi:MAG: EVE domain-containing protein [Salaquimonas sp.]|jgi:hypothetical protein|nr:EVE domain-containing protein [Salaquimonas sp.]